MAMTELRLLQSRETGDTSCQEPPEGEQRQMQRLGTITLTNLYRQRTDYLESSFAKNVLRAGLDGQEQHEPALCPGRQQQATSDLGGQPGGIH